jgi:predicted O-methyltransferase YrrM
MTHYRSSKRSLRSQAVAVLFLLGCVPIAALSATSPLDDGPPVPGEQPQRLNFHQVLQRVGKTVLRPGGIQVTRTMHGWADVSNGCSVLELCAGLGTGGMALAADRGCHVLLTDQDEERLVQAEKLAVRRGLGGLVRTKRVDMTKIDQDLGDENFEATIVEASLTHCPHALKIKILQDLLKHSKQILLHEIGLRDTFDDSDKANQVRREVGDALAIGFYPLTVEGWVQLVEECGYTITNIENGPMRFLNPRSMLQDEGPAGVINIAWNLATHEDLRERVLSTKAVLESHSDTLGYVALRAVKK